MRADPLPLMFLDCKVDMTQIRAGFRHHRSSDGLFSQKVREIWTTFRRGATQKNEKNTRFRGHSFFMLAHEFDVKDNKRFGGKRTSVMHRFYLLLLLPSMAVTFLATPTRNRSRHPASSMRQSRRNPITPLQIFQTMFTKPSPSNKGDSFDLVVVGAG